ncbi:hypothetical protein FHS10_000141 [Mucilaginibacter dorajii]|nr:hypothetical protein [Mucilaginibacter dorajii]
MFGKSFGYQMADDRYTALIEPHLRAFSLKELEAIVEEVNGNSQVNGRRRARTDNYNVKERILELNKNFSFAKYQNFV